MVMFYSRNKFSMRLAAFRVTGGTLSLTDLQGEDKPRIETSQPFNIPK